MQNNERLQSRTTTMNNNLTEAHKAWKEGAAESLHRYANKQGFCSEFDLVLRQNGLPMRERYACEPDCNCGRAPVEAVGEPTVEAFEAWRKQTSRNLYEEAERHGLRAGWEEVLKGAGFLVPEPVKAKINVSYVVELEYTIKVFEGEGYIDVVNEEDVRRSIASRIESPSYYSEDGRGDLNWKVVKADGNS